MTTTTLANLGPAVSPGAVVHKPGNVERLVTGQATSDGDGVKLTRVLTQPLQRRLEPFLRLDAFGSDDAFDSIGGFPDHPHRGFETVTCMIAGRLRHRESAGKQGLLENGSVQWMTAGRGLIHSELPEQEEGRMEGFQLWLNLPAADKMGTPGYRDVPTGEISELRLAGTTVRVIAGASHGVAGAVQKAHTEPLCLDVHLEPGTTFEQSLPVGHDAFAYAYRGALDIDAGTTRTTVPRERMAVLANAADCDGVRLQADLAGARAPIIGKPLNEPIAQYGPFVMNKQAEIFQAVGDFRAGKFGTPPGR